MCEVVVFYLLTTFDIASSLTIYKTQLTGMPRRMESIRKYVAFAKRDLKRNRRPAKVGNTELLNKVKPPAGSIVGG